VGCVGSVKSVPPRKLKQSSQDPLENEGYIKKFLGIIFSPVIPMYLFEGDSCPYSHNVCQPRKMELCKFYLKDTCRKRDRCLYLHEDFPCKYFHTNMKCYANKKCKFSHEPLNSTTREIVNKVIKIIFFLLMLFTSKSFTMKYV